MLIFQIALGTMLGGLCYEISIILISNLCFAIKEHFDGGNE